MKEKQKKPISKQAIFKMMVNITYIVATIFCLKNLIGKQIITALIIGALLAIFFGVLYGMKRFEVAEEKQQLAVCLSLNILIFIISLFSGESFSDDFLLHMAALCLAGLYLRPRQTAIQGSLSLVLLVIQGFICPQKMGGFGQYALCVAMYVLAVALFYETIKRGRAFIEMSQVRAEEAEELLGTLREMGEKLEENFKNSSEGIKGLREASENLNCSAEELKRGSSSITQGTQEVSTTCDNAQEKIAETEKQVDVLTDDVREFEELLAVNRENMSAMGKQIETVQNTIQQANEVFALLEQYMKEISGVTEQLNGISSSTTMLALNASIEASRAGQSGAGFAVVATKVQELAVDSNKCSNQVATVVGQMQRQVQMTTTQLVESEKEIHTSLDTLQGLQDSFDQLTEHFSSLYQDIESQNSNMNQVNAIFENLKERINEMNQYSKDNQGAVDAIAEAMEVYQNSMEQMITDTEHIHELSVDMTSM